jgi:hypothetical protein
MKKFVAVLAAAAAATCGPAFAAADHATAEQAVAMVAQGIAFIREQGPAAGYAEITRGGEGRFRDRDLYLVVYGLDGKVHAHGANPKMVGKDLIDLRDIDGKPFVRERVELGRKNASFWQDYKFTNPVSKRAEPKRMYCERLDETVVCGGIYTN